MKIAGLLLAIDNMVVDASLEFFWEQFEEICGYQPRNEFLSVVM